MRWALNTPARYFPCCDATCGGGRRAPLRISGAGCCAAQAPSNPKRTCHARIDIIETQEACLQGGWHEGRPRAQSTRLSHMQRGSCTAQEGCRGDLRSGGQGAKLPVDALQHAPKLVLGNAFGAPGRAPAAAQCAALCPRCSSDRHFCRRLLCLLAPLQSAPHIRVLHLPPPHVVASRRSRHAAMHACHLAMSLNLAPLLTAAWPRCAWRGTAARPPPPVGRGGPPTTPEH